MGVNPAQQEGRVEGFVEYRTASNRFLLESVFKQLRGIGALNQMSSDKLLEELSSYPELVICDR